MSGDLTREKLRSSEVRWLLPGPRLDLALFLFLAASRFFILYQLFEASLWPAPHLDLSILFACACSSCLTVNRLERQREARYKCRHQRELQAKPF